jgi:hypothetical protein
MCIFNCALKVFCQSRTLAVFWQADDDKLLMFKKLVLT